MSIRFTDSEIEKLINEKKPLEENFRSKIRLRDKSGHKEQELDIKSVDNNQFRLIMRQSSFNVLDFSVILAFCPSESNQLFRLRRYNGKSHEHTNKIESNTFYNFHIHFATERYQDLGSQEDSYAEPSNRFSDFHSAIDCMLNDCGFHLPKDPQQILFE